MYINGQVQKRYRPRDLPQGSSEPCPLAHFGEWWYEITGCNLKSKVVESTKWFSLMFLQEHRWHMFLNTARSVDIKQHTGFQKISLSKGKSSRLLFEQPTYYLNLLAVVSCSIKYFSCWMGFLRGHLKLSSQNRKYREEAATGNALRTLVISQVFKLGIFPQNMNWHTLWVACSIAIRLPLSPSGRVCSP